ncbi:MAG: aminotransferase class IV [Chitinophagaceae bacterium]
MNVYANQNGLIIREDKAVVSINNRGFRYGDGFFETMKFMNNQIVLSDYHFERLFHSLKVLQFDVPSNFTASYFTDQIKALVQKNGHSKLARIRLTIYRSEGGLYDPKNHVPNYTIQTWALNAANNQLNENGLVIDFFEDAQKSCDIYSSIKSSNYLPYAMAALWAKNQHLNDALVLNTHHRIADATIANIFIVKDNSIFTPALSEGCVNGVMRKHIIHYLHSNQQNIQETSISKQDVLEADEVFLTNGIYGIRWVQNCGNKKYHQLVIRQIYKQAISPLFTKNNH